MRPRDFARLLLFACCGCTTTGIPAGPPDTATSPTDFGVIRVSCADPDGTVMPLPTLAMAKALLPGRWQSCTRTSDVIGPWTPQNLAGLELIADDSVTPADAGGGRWYFLEAKADGTIGRGAGFDAGGTFLYNPLPGPDWEQISLSAAGQYADFTVAFTDNPRKLRLLGPAGFAGTFAPLSP